MENNSIIENLLTENVVNDMVDYLYSKGMIMKNKDLTGAIHVPICIIPAPVVKQLFEKMNFYQVAFNKLIDRMSRNPDFLKEVLSKFAESDNFIKRYLNILEVSEANKNKQNIQLGIFRNDFMMDKYKKFLYQVELNTIAASMGFFSDSLRNFHKYFTDKYPQIFQNFNNSKENEDQEKEISYKVPFDRPEVIPNIAKALDEALTLYINNFNNSNNLLNAIDNDLQNKFFSKKNVSILFVINEKERNMYDIRQIENLLYEKYKVNIMKMTLQQIHDRAKLDKNNGELIIDKKIIGLVYFRSSYDETNFPTEDCWKARETLELSNAIKCPNVNLFLCTFKVFQHELNKKEELIANDISRFFTKIYNLKDMDNSGRLEVMKILKENYNKYIVKPQKEGGTHNYYGKEILDLLTENFLDKNLSINPILIDSIIMEKIHPPTFTSYILRENHLQKQECISEISTYGIILSKPNNDYIINKSSGFLIRSKSINENEGGIASGSSAVDLPALIDLNLSEEKEIEFKNY